MKTMTKPYRSTHAPSRYEDEREGLSIWDTLFNAAWIVYALWVLIICGYYFSIVFGTPLNLAQRSESSLIALAFAGLPYLFLSGLRRLR